MTDAVRRLRTVPSEKTRLKDYATNEALRTAMQGYTDLFQTGHRELLQTA